MRFYEGKLVIDPDLFWEWVHGFMGQTDDEVVFANPEFNEEGYLTIKYAGSDVTHPDHWPEDKKPEWMREDDQSEGCPGGSGTPDQAGYQEDNTQTSEASASSS